MELGKRTLAFIEAPMLHWPDSMFSYVREDAILFSNQNIIDAYISWVRNEVKPKVVIVYETMWGATEKMARKIAEGIVEQRVSVKIFDIVQSERTEIIKEMLDAKGYVIGSSTHDILHYSYP